MHPAYSVIVFTVASGAGYGLLAWLGLFAAAGAVPQGRAFAVTSLGLALALVTVGLLASTLHLGHPERAWRAVSQWRSSWLSREGVASLATYLPALAFAAGWIGTGRSDGVVAAAGLVAAACAGATVVTTGMIYASLKPIPQWHSPYTVPVYLLHAGMSGAVLLHALLRGFSADAVAAAALAGGLTAAAWAVKEFALRRNDARALPVTANSAIGLSGGAIRVLEWPHTEENYLLKEMGYRIARRHAARLRRLMRAFAYAVPLLAALGALLAGGLAATVLAMLAVPVQAAGLLIERWLFFAEARHTVTLYYGR
jgi:DMSO reductase anchor subunit